MQAQPKTTDAGANYFKSHRVFAGPSAGWQLWVRLDFKVTAFEFSHWPAGDWPRTAARPRRASSTSTGLVAYSSSSCPLHIRWAHTTSAGPAAYPPQAGQQHLHRARSTSAAARPQQDQARECFSPSRVSNDTIRLTFILVVPT